MLGKLIRHEFRATAVPMLLLSAGVILFAALTGLFTWLTSLADFMTFFLSLSIGAYMLALMASYIVVFVLIVMRFYKNIYGYEGYITLTLPVKRWKLVFSKLLVSVVWCIVNGAATVLSLLLVAVSFGDGFSSLSGVLREVMYMASMVLRQLHMPAALVVIELILAAIVGLFMNVLMLYASVSFGQLFKKHRIFGSILGYLIMYTISQIIMSVYMMVIGTVGGFASQMFAPYGPALTPLNLFTINVMIVLYFVILIAVTLLYYIITQYVINRAVNLQ